MQATVWNRLRGAIKMKGQLSYIIKPVSLVITIILLLLLYNSISSFTVREKEAQQSLNIAADATNILLLLSNSPLCLAYKAPATQGQVANTVDIQKLNSFSQIYSSKEPDCARNFDYGWRITVKEFKQTGGTTVYGNAWSFGAAQFSQGSASTDSLNFSLPIAIHYSDSLTMPGIMIITIVNGELEKISGVIDWACDLHRQGSLTKSTVQIHTSYPISYDASSQSLCQVSKTKWCRITDCSLDFSGLKASGTYLIKISFDGDTEVIR